MKKIIFTFARMWLGFLAGASGTVMAVNSNLGLSPWDVFHQGLTNVFPITMGQASIIASLVVIAVTTVFGLNIGLGTILNMLGIGMLIDVIMYLEIIPESHSLFTGILLMMGSLVAVSLATYLYMGCEMGCGPRDGMMVVLAKKTNKPMGLIRFFIEGAVFVIGFLLGGKVGIGTLITVFGMGYCLQILFKILKFDAKSIHHMSLRESFYYIKDCLQEAS